MQNEWLTSSLKKYYRDFDTTGFNHLDFIHRFGSPLEVLLYSMLVWPDFVEIEGMVFLKDWVEDEDDVKRIKNVLLKNRGDKSETEKSFNNFELASFFGPKSGDIENKGYLELAKVLKDSWSAKLQRDFPGKIYRVEVIEPKGNQDTGILFYGA